MAERLIHPHLDLSALLPAVCQIALSAGEKIMEMYQCEDLGVQYKRDKSPVTQADFAADEIITRELQRLTPDIPILSEEGKELASFEERSGWQAYWLVDPLDGTKGFICRNGFFTVNIALIVNHQSALGVIYAPDHNTLYYATQNDGAHKQIGNEPAKPISVCKTRREIPVVVVSRFHINKPTYMLMEALKEIKTTKMDSSLKCCLVAEGSADLYLRVGPTCEWDTGAGQCIVEQAGGYLTDITGTPLAYNKKDSLINPPFVVHTPTSPEWQKVMAHLQRSDADINNNAQTKHTRDLL